MKERKSIDRLFREKFKDFEATPHPALWNRIQSDLKGVKKTSLIPLWVKLSGVAALLVMAFFIGKNWLISEATPPSVVNSPTPIEYEKEASPQTSTRAVLTSIKPVDLVKAEVQMPSFQAASPYFFKKYQPIDEHRAQEGYKSAPSSPSQDFLALEAEKERKKSTLRDSLYHSGGNKQDSPIKQRSLFEEIAQQQQQETTSKETEKSPRFALRPNVSPIYYSSMGGGSALDPKFSENKTKGNLTASYGIDVTYAVSKHFKLRSGINKVNLSYNTPDIAYLAAQSHIGIRALGAKDNLNNAVIVSTVSKKNLAEAVQNNAQKITMASAYTEAELHQELSYIEIPVEFMYSLVDQRFGIQLIGGTSALVLNNDRINLTSAVETKNLGRAENVNSFSFTANFGMGFNYKLSEHLGFSVEPTFKYQLNGFRGETENFKPYYLGLYSGISFKF